MYSIYIIINFIHSLSTSNSVRNNTLSLGSLIQVIGRETLGTSYNHPSPRPTHSCESPSSTSYQFEAQVHFSASRYRTSSWTFADWIDNRKPFVAFRDKSYIPWVSSDWPIMRTCSFSFVHAIVFISHFTIRNSTPHQPRSTMERPRSPRPMCGLYGPGKKVLG